MPAVLSSHVLSVQGARQYSCWGTLLFFGLYSCLCRCVVAMVLVGATLGKSRLVVVLMVLVGATLGRSRLVVVAMVLVGATGRCTPKFGDM